MTDKCNGNGIVYFIQPYEFIKEKKNIIKIGMSQKQHFYRVYTGYKKKSKWFSIHQVSDPVNVEKKLKLIFKNKFVLVKGLEYFSGDIMEMFSEYNNIVLPYVLNCDDEYIDDKEFMKTSVKKYFDGDKYKCPTCLYTTPNYNYFFRHKNKKKPCVKPKYKYICNKCQKQFKKKNALDEHIKIHHKIDELNLNSDQIKKKLKQLEEQRKQKAKIIFQSQIRIFV